MSILLLLFLMTVLLHIYSIKRNRMMRRAWLLDYENQTKALDEAMAKIIGEPRLSELKEELVIDKLIQVQNCKLRALYQQSLWNSYKHAGINYPDNPRIGEFSYLGN